MLSYAAPHRASFNAARALNQTTPRNKTRVLEYKS